MTVTLRRSERRTACEPAQENEQGSVWPRAATAALVYGSITNAPTHQTYTSYQAQPNSPGATLLSNYKLRQVQCGPPGLVVMYGPNNKRYLRVAE